MTLKLTQRQNLACRIFIKDSFEINSHVKERKEIGIGKKEKLSRNPVSITVLEDLLGSFGSRIVHIEPSQDFVLSH